MRQISNDEFNKKYYLYKPMIYNISYTYVHNVYDADDIVQDVFIKYLNSNQEFPSEENEKYWLIRVTINTCKSFVTNGWKKKVELSNEKIDRYQKEDSKENNQLLEIVCSLPQKYKEIIILYYFEELPINDISKVLKITISSVKKRLERARKIIRERNKQNG